MNQTLDTAMIFSAGFGTRMSPITDKTPKPLVSVGNKTLLDHTINLANNGHVNKIFINTHYLSNQIEKHVQIALKNFDLKKKLIDEYLIDNFYNFGSSIKYTSEEILKILDQ